MQVMETAHIDSGYDLDMFLFFRYTAERELQYLLYAVSTFVLPLFDQFQTEFDQLLGGTRFVYLA
jgi:hypothetical protein